MHLLLGFRELLPAKVADEFRTVGDGFPAPESDHSGHRHRVAVRPVDGSGLLLHDAETTATDTSIQVVVKCRPVRMARLPVAALGRFVAPGLLQKTERVAVPAGDIDGFTNVEMIEVGEVAHEIVRQPDVFPATGSNTCCLALAEAPNLIRRKAPERERMRRIRFSDGGLRKSDRVEPGYSRLRNTVLQASLRPSIDS